MADSWVEHSLEFESHKQTSQQKQTPQPKQTNQTINKPPLVPAEAIWHNDSSFQIPQSGDTQAERQRIYLSQGTLPNLQKRNEYTTEVRNDPSYKFLMMVAAFSKRKLGSVLQITPNNARNKTTVCQLTTSASRSDNAHGWLLMPEISGLIQLSPEIYGHIKEAEQILSSFGNIPALQTLIEDRNYQTLFARLVAVRMGLSDYLSHSEKAKDRIFVRLHQEQTMLLRRLRSVKIPYNRVNWSQPHSKKK